MNKEKFLEKYEGKAIHCDTEEKANDFLGLCDKFDIEWVYDGKATSDNLWWAFNDNICYFIDQKNKLTCGDIDYAKEKNYEIIEFELLKNNENSKTKDINEIKNISIIDCHQILKDDLIFGGSIFQKNTETNDKKLKTKLKRKKTFTNTQQIYDILKQMLILIEKLIDKGDENGRE